MVDGLSPDPVQPSLALKVIPPLLPVLTPLNPVEDLLTAACSSILPGAGTNQELALHCLHESRGDILVRQHRQWREGGTPREAGMDPCLLPRNQAH